MHPNTNIPAGARRASSTSACVCNEFWSHRLATDATVTISLIGGFEEDLAARTRSVLAPAARI
jgi:hypothetical protein